VRDTLKCSINKCIILYLDLKKVFDSIVHSNLIVKLERLGLCYELFSWLSEFLTGHVQCVQVNKHVPETAPACSGITQGSVLGPILFLLYFNYLPASLFNTLTSRNMSNYELQVCADDIKTYANIRSSNDAARFQLVKTPDSCFQGLI